jgi:hypothetical protein
MTLAEAAAVLFPEGPLSLSSLRTAVAAGDLEIVRVAGKDLTTPAPSESWWSRYAGPQSQAASTLVPRRRRDQDHLHRGRQVRTGCSRDDTEGAAKALENYLGSAHETTVGATDPRFLAIADVITFYEQLKRPKTTDPRAEAHHELLLIRLEDLNGFFGAKMVSDIKAQLCRDFVDWSTGTANENNRKTGIMPRARTVSDQTARRRLEDLRAAINAYHAEHVLNVVPKVTLPAKADGRHRWLTRNEAARLVGAAIGYVWDKERGSWKRHYDGLLMRRRPAARFMLIGLYSARREETIRRTQWLPTLTHPWMNPQAMIYQGRGAAEARTILRPDGHLISGFRATARTLTKLLSSEPPWPIGLLHNKDSGWS